MAKYLLKFFFILVISSLLPLQVMPEGTKQILLSDAGHGKIEIMPGFNDFAWYDDSGNSASDEYRLYIHIGAVGEKIYFGFGDALNNNDQVITSVSYRIKDPLGNIVWGPGTVPQLGVGYIDTYAKAVAGPQSIVGGTGYSNRTFVPTMTGDYWMEFHWNTGDDRCKFKYFDITVASAANVAINGRVYSKGWQMTADDLYLPFLGKLFVYSDDHIVTSINFNGMQPFVFSVACNQFGCYNTGNFNSDRRSVSGYHTNPQYKIFLNNPDINEYPTGALGSITPPVVITPDCSGTANVQITVTQPGNVNIVLDINPAPGIQAEDVQLSATVVTGVNNISWNGLNGLGQPVVNGASFNVSITYINGLTNLPIYDVEVNPSGFIVQLTRPVGPAPMTYWDDTLVGGGQQFNGCTYVLPSTGCHLWDYSVGNDNTVNTWWYAVTSTQSPVVFTELRGPQPLGSITGPVQVCTGTTGNIYWVHSDPNSTSYVWSFTGTGATITPVNASDTMVSVDFAPGATSGNLTVSGNNVTCGNGTSSTLAIAMLPPSNVSLNPFSPVCVNAPAFLLTGGSPAGGVYTLAGNPITTFDPSVTGAGTFPIMYTYSPAGVCPGFATQNVVVNPLPVVTLSALNPVCSNTPAFLLTGGSPVGGTFSGPGVSGGQFDPGSVGPGTYTVTYTYTDANSCTNSDSKTITVNPVPVVTLSPFSPVCISAAPFSLAGGAPAGGTYSGPGVAGGIFSPAVAGAGMHTITYTYTDANGCISSGSNTILVNPLPVVTFSALAPVCISAAPFALAGGSPAGGTYSGPGVAGGNFSPAVAGVGTFTITYTYTDGNGCINTATQNITVNPLPVVALAALNPVCIDAPPFLLTGGLPAGGTYSGPGVAAGMFDPATTGAGTFLITYTYTDANGCTNSDSKQITVNPLPIVTFAALNPVCINIPPFLLTGGTPAGGTYSGTGVAGGLFDPSAAGAGTFTLTYSYTNANGCTNSATQNITVNPLPSPAGNIAGANTACQASTGIAFSVAVIANATSYSWSIVPPGAGTINGNTNSITIDWAAGFSGIANIFVMGVNNCGNGIISAAFQVTVNPKPIVTYNICADTITLSNAQPILLKGGIPLNGTYSGAGVVGGQFFPGVAGPGSHPIQYSYTNMYGCINSAVRNIVVINSGAFLCGSNLTDLRDNKVYKTIQIGAQCWMAENLNYGTTVFSSMFQTDNCIPEKYCFNDNPATCGINGGLYQWDEVMTYRTVSGIQGLCPPAWHVPSDAEWTVLFAQYINNGFAASPLKYTGYSGFDALLSGVDFFNKNWNFTNFATLMWTSTAYTPYKAWAHGMNSFDPSVSLYPSSRSNAFSVRCIKD